ncbi:hypothetical protein [Neobacillus niacini]|uniref:hypothetical protein n=1 Tax=Neobacillus niacini TaxID=86668 RepID=UPI003982F909
MIRERTLHILNGQAMYLYFKKTHFLEKELMVPFNEDFSNVQEKLGYFFIKILSKTWIVYDSNI